MDEGWATLAEFYLSPMIDPEGIGKYDISTMNNSAGTDEDVPVITPTAQLYGKARFTDKDLKPALALLYLKEMMGDDLFLKATHYYIRSWHGKHPTPYDFFNCMSAGSGLNLNWFWKNWFIEKNVPDLAISKVSRHKLNYAITVSSPGSLSVPIHLTVIYNDGSSAKMSRNIGCWAKKNKVVILRFKAGKKVKEIILGNAFDVDIRPEDNHWKSH